MNKKVFVLILGGIIAATLVFAAARSKDTGSPAAPESQKAPAAQDTEQPQAGGKYIDYTQTAIQETAGDKVLFFHAPWCPQCRAIESDINEQGVPTGITIIKVDYDTNQELRQKYGVTLQTTFVKVDDQGNLVSKYVAYNEPTFDAVRRNIL